MKLFFTENQNNESLQTSTSVETEEKMKTLLSCAAADMKAKAIYYGMVKMTLS